MHFLKKYRLIFITLIAAFALIGWIYTNAPEPQEKAADTKVPKVPYVHIVVGNEAIPIFSRGRVSASEVRQITNEVPGLVKRVSDNLKKGARVKEGDLLVQLDEQPYILDIAQKQADLDRVKLELVKIKAKAIVAQKGLQENASEYARHIPQVRHASSQVAAAEAALSYAKKQLKKTTINAPIDGKVVELTITEGEYINATSSLAKIYGTQTVDVRLPLNDQQIEILGLANENDLIFEGRPIGPQVTLRSYQNRDSRWLGFITRTEGERDINQLIYVLAQVSSDAPFNSAQKPLLPGSFVEAEIEGKPVNNLQIIPRNAEQANNTVWVIDENEQLRRKIVDIIYRGKKQAYLRSGLTKNDRVVTGSFHLMAEGLKVHAALSSSELFPHKTVSVASQ
jgi:RND family efflux transporter MFP subunit